MKALNTVFLFLISTLTICSCGSGGSNEGETTQSQQTQPSETNETAEQNQETEIVVEPTVVTEELVVPEEFLLNSTKRVNIDINVGSLSNTAAFINICKVRDDDTINYQDCIIKQNLHGGQLQKQVEVANNITNLAVSIWQYDINIAPILYRRHKDDGEYIRLIQ